MASSSSSTEDVPYIIREQCTGLPDPPSSVCLSSITVAPDVQSLFVFGGSENVQFIDTFWQMNIPTLHWSKPKTTGLPTPRHRHTGNWIPPNKHIPFLGNYGSLFLFGGNDAQIYHNEVTLYDPDTLVWTRPVTRGPIPRGRALHSATLHEDKMYIFGGVVGDEDEMDSVLKDLCVLDLKTWTWAKPVTVDHRYAHVTTIMDDRLYFLGGRDAKDRLISGLFSVDLAVVREATGDGTPRSTEDRANGISISMAGTAAAGPAGRSNVVTLLLPDNRPPWVHHRELSGPAPPELLQGFIEASPDGQIVVFGRPAAESYDIGPLNISPARRNSTSTAPGLWTLDLVSHRWTSHPIISNSLRSGTWTFFALAEQSLFDGVRFARAPPNTLTQNRPGHDFLLGTDQILSANSPRTGMRHRPQLGTSPSVLSLAMGEQQQKRGDMRTSSCSVHDTFYFPPPIPPPKYMVAFILGSPTIVSTVPFSRYFSDVRVLEACHFGLSSKQLAVLGAEQSVNTLATDFRVLLESGEGTDFRLLCAEDEELDSENGSAAGINEEFQRMDDIDAGEATARKEVPEGAFAYGSENLPATTSSVAIGETGNPLSDQALKRKRSTSNDEASRSGSSSPHSESSRGGRGQASVGKPTANVIEKKIGSHLATSVLKEGIGNPTRFTVTNGRDMLVHKAVLLARWPHFAAVCRSGMSENTMGVYKFQENRRVVKAFIHWLYTDQILIEPECRNENHEEEISKDFWVDVVADLMVMANMYLLDRLRLLCRTALRSRLNTQNAALIYSKASLTGDRELAAEARTMIYANYGEVVKTKGYRDLPKELLFEIWDGIPGDAKVANRGNSLGGAKRNAELNPPKKRKLHGTIN